MFLHGIQHVTHNFLCNNIKSNLWVSSSECRGHVLCVVGVIMLGVKGWMSSLYSCMKTNKLKYIPIYTYIIWRDNASLLQLVLGIVSMYLFKLIWWCLILIETCSQVLLYLTTYLPVDAARVSFLLVRPLGSFFAFWFDALTSRETAPVADPLA
jgi:hypothetical protein